MPPKSVDSSKAFNLNIESIGRLEKISDPNSTEGRYPLWSINPSASTTPGMEETLEGQHEAAASELVRPERKSEKYAQVEKYSNAEAHFV